MFCSLKRHNLRLIFAVIFLCSAVSFVFAGSGRPKYIFLMIGDGMGTGQCASAERYYRSMQMNQGLAESEIKKLEMNSLPVIGLASTFSANASITDSGAAGTALATGCKTDTGIISMDAAKKAELQTVAERAKKCGFKIGIISSIWINHATPAVFYSHQPSRNNYYDIAMDLANSDFDYFGGGKACGIGKDKLKGRPNPVDVAVKNGFTIADTPEKIAALTADDASGKIWVYDKNQDTLYYEINRPAGSIELCDFTTKAIELLKNKTGFFIMVEGGKIDWACHSNDTATVIKDVIAFNKAVKAALAFYEKHKDETLIIITADHETGGMRFSPEFTNVKDRDFAKIIDGQRGSEGKFTAIIEACKKNKMTFKQALNSMNSFFSISTLSSDEEKMLEKAFIQGGTMEGDFRYGDNRTITITYTRILGQRAGITWQGLSHTSDFVPVMAIGTGSELFSGFYDNTDIAKKIFSLLPTAN